MKIAAVIVTYNRLQKLKNTIHAYENLSVNTDYFVIVNNHSTDGTAEFLTEWQRKNSNFKKEIINLQENMGGSGGFHEAVNKAMSYDVDWILLADDDAYPDKDIIENFKYFVENTETSNISAICSTVRRTDGTVDVGHRKWLHYKFGLRPQFIPSKITDYEKKSFDIDLFSYVGVFLKKTILYKAGLCNPNMFIYYDDIEHSLRVRQTGRIICVPSLIFDHDDGAGQSIADETILMSWRDYYAIRNKIFTFLKHQCCAGVFWTATRFAMCFVKYPFNRQCQRLYLTAIFDGIKGRLGKHPTYRPGFTIKKKL